MSTFPQVKQFSAAEIIRMSSVAQAASGMCFASAGETGYSSAELERMAGAVPRTVAAALTRKAFYFVPLVVPEPESEQNAEKVFVAERYDVALGDRAVCHRNVSQAGSQCVFISTKLMEDRFSVAFEFFINVAHAFVDTVGLSDEFNAVTWKHVEQGVRGETSLDAYELRRAMFSGKAERESVNLPVNDEKAKTAYLETTFSDAVAIYMLSLYLDVDYFDLREREYPLLAPAAMAERVQKIASMFPANDSYEFSIHYRRK
jgi:hypothetical protein